MKPPVSHRYLAVRSGIGHFGLSGHIITKDHGSAIVLASVFTDEELTPTDSLPEVDNYCDECRLCFKVCSSGFVDPVEKVTVTLEGKEFNYGKRRSYTRCTYVCGGFSGLNPSGKWSTWSPARFKIPEKDEDFPAAQFSGLQAYLRRPGFEGGFFMSVMQEYRMEYTCSNCQLVCYPYKESEKHATEC